MTIYGCNTPVLVPSMLIATVFTLGNWRSVRSICARIATTRHEPATWRNSALKSARAVPFSIVIPFSVVPEGISLR
ncbi:MAG: hypothetical protein ABIR47_09930 [Candidatus Kapaibacterium sp.]